MSYFVHRWLTLDNLYSCFRLVSYGSFVSEYRVTSYVLLVLVNVWSDFSNNEWILENMSFYMSLSVRKQISENL